ncbi:hypothetical protein L208DRAFT_1408171, partial [Tricholoma matsutake]
MQAQGQGRQQPSTHPHHCEQLLAGWTTGGTTTRQPTTHPQPHEQLLVGWIVGGTTTMTTHHLPPASRATARGVDRGWKDRQQRGRVPSPSPALCVGRDSFCTF